MARPSSNFGAQHAEELRRLEVDLWSDTYRPQAVRRAWISKPGSTEKRPLGIPTVRDRVVQTALLHVLEPIFDVTFAEHSYGFRHGRGCHHALERVEALLKEGYVYVVDADLKSYFDTIPKDRLMARVSERVSDSQVLRWVKMFLDQGVMDGLDKWTPETGTPQGAVLSPLLANIYLNPLDHQVAGAGLAMVRYADDFVILCRTREEADRALATGEGVGRGKWPDSAPGQDEDRGRTDGGSQLSGLHLSRPVVSAAQEKPGQAEGDRSWENAPHQRAQPDADCQVAERDVAGMVWVFPTLQLDRLSGPG